MLMLIKIGKYKDNGKQFKYIHIDKYDTFSMDNTLAHIIHPMLVQLRDTTHGYAHIKDNADGFDFNEELFRDDALMNDDAQMCWSTILDEMIWTFEQIKDDSYEHEYYCPFYLDNLTNRDWSNLEAGLRERPLGAHDDRGAKLHEERIKKGLVLFGKYYQHLWD